MVVEQVAFKIYGILLPLIPNIKLTYLIKLINYLRRSAGDFYRVAYAYNINRGVILVLTSCLSI